MTNKTDSEFLNWIADRLIHVYGENPNTDFILHLKEIVTKRRNAVAEIQASKDTETKVRELVEKEFEYWCVQTSRITREYDRNLTAASILAQTSLMLQRK